MSAALAYAYIDGIAITLFASIAVAVIRSAPNRLASWLVALLVFNAICNVIAARQDGRVWYRHFHGGPLVELPTA